MPQWLVIALMVGQLLPLIQDAVKWVESIATGQPGAFKKEQALAFLRAVLQGTAPFSKLDAATIEALITIAGPLIDMVVTILNATGVFKKAP